MQSDFNMEKKDEEISDLSDAIRAEFYIFLS